MTTTLNDLIKMYLACIHNPCILCYSKSKQMANGVIDLSLDIIIIYYIK